MFDRQKDACGMQRFDREDTPEKRGDELRALNPGDHLTLLDVPSKGGGLASNRSSTSDFHQGFRDVRDTAPIYDRDTRAHTVVSHAQVITLAFLPALSSDFMSYTRVRMIHCDLTMGALSCLSWQRVNSSTENTDDL